MKFREEEWGLLVYDPELDEFEAELSDNHSEITIDRPVSAGCLVTGKCNLRCDFCYGNDETLPREELTVKEWTQVFAHLKSWGLMRVDLSGGEPTVRRDIGEIAQAGLDAGFVVVLSTNGLVLQDNDWKRLPSAIRIHVSVDSGFPAVHENSRLKGNLLPSVGSFVRTKEFILKALSQSYRLRVLTCVGLHNYEGLFELGECLALAGVAEWNVSRILSAGRAQSAYNDKWLVADSVILEQIHDMRKAYPWLRIRYSSRVEQGGYFLLVLPDGTLVTQYTDGRDKVPLGRVLDMELADLQNLPDFNLTEHARKWIASIREFQCTVF